MERGKKEPIQVKCPRCKLTEIIYIPDEDIPHCPECGTRMVIVEPVSYTHLTLPTKRIV